MYLISINSVIRKNYGCFVLKESIEKVLCLNIKDLTVEALTHWTLVIRTISYLIENMIFKPGKIYYKTVNDL